MDSIIQLTEGMRLPRNIFNAFLSRLENDPFRMGFEVEFYAEEQIHGKEVANLDRISYYEAQDYFRNTEVSYDALSEWMEMNEELVFDEAEIDRNEIEDEVFEEWFDDNPDWYQEYLEEINEWDDENDEPAKNASDKDAAREEVKQEIRDDIKSFGRYEDFDSKVREKISEIIDNRVNLAELWWRSDHHDFIEKNFWELDYDYRFDEHDDDIIREGYGGDLEHLGELLSDIVDENVEVDDNDYVDDITTDRWVVKKDASLSEEDGGVEIASPIFPITQGIERLETILDWIDEIDGTTNASTGLHISLSFTEYKEVHDIDWLKVAILSGEKHMLEQFNRLFNATTHSQLQSVQDTARSGDIEQLQKLRTFQELKDRFAEGISGTTKERSFNLKDYEHSFGRVEWRIMGGAGYHQKFDIIKSNIYKLAFAMEIGADPEAFKEQYLRELGKLLATVLEAKPDTLSDKQKMLYGDEEKSEILRRSPLFPKAVTLLKGSPLLEYYKNWTLLAEYDKENPTEYNHNQSTRAANVFLAEVVKLQAQEYEAMFSLRASIDEAITASSKLQMIIRLARETCAHYGFNGEDYKELYRKDPATALIEHYPIADHLTMPLGLAYSVAALVFTEMDAELKDRKMKILQNLQVLRSFGPAVMYVLSAISYSTKKTIGDHQAMVVNYLKPSIDSIRSAKASGNPVNMQQVRLIDEILQTANLPEEIKKLKQLVYYWNPEPEQTLDNQTSNRYHTQHEQ